MIKVLFVCHGNICRSVMAEYIFKDYIRRMNKEDLFYCESRAVSAEEEGHDIYYQAKKCLIKHNIPFDRHYSTVVKKQDYDDYDYIYAMDDYNIWFLSRMFKDKDDKIKLLNPKGIEDPWPCGDFDKTYYDILEGIETFLKELL